MGRLNRDEEIFLSESYEITVKLQSRGHFFAGHLSLTPQRISLYISGDLHDDRVHDLDPNQIEQLECYSLNHKFVLCDLHFTNNQIQWLDHTRRLRHFEYTYQAAAVLVVPQSFDANEINEVNIYSPTVSDWVGVTQAQHEYLAHSPSELQPDLASVLYTEMPNRGAMEIAYITTSHFSQTTRSAGIGFEIYTNFTPTEPLTQRAALEYIEEFRFFFEIIEGADPEITKVHVTSGELDGYLYYPSVGVRHRQSAPRNLFPLGHELLHPSGLPKFPIESISAFFTLDKILLERWKKAVRYRHLGVLEDRFLGAFRLVEAFTLQKACYIQDEDLLASTLTRIERLAIKLFSTEKPANVRSFLGRMRKLNHQRYNTATCVQKLYKTLPRELTSTWRYQVSDIPDISQKRNDITHANPYFFTDSELLSWTAFVEALLFISLMDSIAVPRASTIKILPRTDGYSLLLKPRNSD
jgi:hypothetical protein